MAKKRSKARTARMVVNHVLKWVDKCGRIEGQGKDRHVTFPSIVDLKTSKTTAVVDRITKQVGEYLEAMSHA